MQKYGAGFPQLTTGQRICINCRFHILNNCRTQTHEEECESDSEESPIPNVREARSSFQDHDHDARAKAKGNALNRVNSMLKLFSLSPITHPSQRARAAPILKRKYEAINTNIKQDFNHFGPSILSLSPIKAANSCRSCKKLVEDLKKRHSSDALTRREKYQILTCTPDSEGIADIVKNFNCSQYVAREVSKLRSREGAFSAPPPRQGRPLSNDTTQKVIAFYLDPGNSQIQPDKTIYSGTGKSKTRIAKQHMVVTLDELYISFQQRYPNDKVSLSKFSTLRPKQCVWAGANGFHRQCVCEIHQNYHLLLDAVEKDYKTADSMKEIFCDTNDATCMLGKCQTCPNLNLTETWLDDFDPDELIEFLQWTKNISGYSELVWKKLEVAEFMNELKKAIPKVAAHHFLMLQQRDYINSLKLQLKEDEAILYVDFAENYSFVIQDEVQGFHWTNSQATVHPFVLEWTPKEQDKMESKPIVVVSDELQHCASSFHAFRAEAMSVIKKLHPNLQTIHYVSDGAASQYKNYKNFTNLLYHEADFKVKATWAFTATSHGKSRCDGVGAVVKNTARRAALRGKAILTAEDMYMFCQEKLGNSMEFIYMDRESVSTIQEEFKLEERYSQAKTVPGTRKNHYFVPYSATEILVREYASAVESKIISVILIKSDQQEVQLHEFPSVGEFVACRIGNSVEIGMVLNVDLEMGDIQVNLMKKLRSNQFRWFEMQKHVFVTLDEIVRKVSAPVTTTGRLYTLTLEDARMISK